MATDEETWDFRDPASKSVVLGVLEREMADTFDLVADPHRWEAPTACEGWEVRDVIGHLVDTTEGYLPAFSGVGQPYTVGVRTTGRNGGNMRVAVSSEGVQFEPGDLDDCDAILEFDPATLVLTGYARMNGGTVRGDRELAGRFRSLFFPI